MLEEFDYAGRVIVYASITNGRCKILYYFNSKHIKQLQGRTNHLMVAIMKSLNTILATKESTTSCHVIEKNHDRRSGDQRPAAGRVPHPRGPLLAAAGRGHHPPGRGSSPAAPAPPSAAVPPELRPQRNGGGREKKGRPGAAADSRRW